MESKYNCEICTTTFNNLFLYIDHLFEYLNDDNISEKQKLYIKKSTLHNKRIAEECPECDSTIGSYYYYLRHKNSSCKRKINNDIIKKMKHDFLKFNQSELDDIKKYIADIEKHSSKPKTLIGVAAAPLKEEEDIPNSQSVKEPFKESSKDPPKHRKTLIRVVNAPVKETSILLPKEKEVISDPKPTPEKEDLPDLQSQVSKEITTLTLEEPPTKESGITVLNIRKPNKMMLDYEYVDDEIVQTYMNLMDDPKYQNTINTSIIEDALASFYKTIYFNDQYPENHGIYAPDMETLYTYNTSWVKSEYNHGTLLNTIENLKSHVKDWIRSTVKFRISESENPNDTIENLRIFNKLELLDKEIDKFRSDNSEVTTRFHKIANSYKDMVSKTYTATHKQRQIQLRIQSSSKTPK